MGSAYEHLSREELLALWDAPARTTDRGSEAPFPRSRYRQIVEEAVRG